MSLRRSPSARCAGTSPARGGGELNGRASARLELLVSTRYSAGATGTAYVSLHALSIASYESTGRTPRFATAII